MKTYIHRHPPCVCKMQCPSIIFQDSVIYVRVPGEENPEIDPHERLGKLTSQLGRNEFITTCVVTAPKAYMYAVATEEAPFEHSHYKTRLKGVSLSQPLKSSLTIELMQQLAMRGCSDLDEAELEEFYSRLGEHDPSSHGRYAQKRGFESRHIQVPQTRLAKHTPSLSITDASSKSVKVIQGVFDKRVIRYPTDLSDVSFVTSLPFGYE